MSSPGPAKDARSAGVKVMSLSKAVAASSAPPDDAPESAHGIGQPLTATGPISSA
jgi:hypothetical protein